MTITLKNKTSLGDSKTRFVLLIETLPNDFFGPSLSSYSKVFFEEAMTAIRAESTSNMARSAMILYLSFNLERLDERQFQQLWDVLKELKMPWYILWWY